MSRHKLILIFLYGLVALIPGLAMLAAHWFPWRVALGRDLSRVESYMWGTAWIIGVAGAAIRLSQRLDAPATPDQSARLIEVSAASAGAATMAAYAVDAWGQQRRSATQARLVAEAKIRHAEKR